MKKKDQVDDLEQKLSKLLTAKSVVLTQEAWGKIQRGLGPTTLLQPISK